MRLPEEKSDEDPFCVANGTRAEAGAASSAAFGNLDAEDENKGGGGECVCCSSWRLV